MSREFIARWSAGNTAGFAADVERFAVFALDDGNDAAITREAAARFRGNARTVLEVAAAGGVVS